MIEFYPQIKQFHIFVALLSGSLFALRGGFALAGGLVDAAFAAQFVLEVAHGVGEEQLAPIQPGLRQRLIQQLAGGADEGPAGQVFLVARLLTNQHQACAQWAGAVDGLRGAGAERAGGAGLHGGVQAAQRGGRGGWRARDEGDGCGLDRRRNGTRFRGENRSKRLFIRREQLLIL